MISRVLAWSSSACPSAGLSLTVPMTTMEAPVVICVTGSPQVEAVMRGENGVLAGAKPGGYVLRYIVNDVIAERSTPFELPFTLKEKS